MVLGVRLLPRQVEHLCHGLLAAQEHRIAAAVAVLALVELDEVGAGVGPFADEDRDREHRLGHRQDMLGPPRALAGEDEPGEVGARLGGDCHVFFARQPADLHERPVDELAELRSGIRRAHERGPDEHGVSTGELGRRRLSAGLDPALGDHHAFPRSLGDEIELRGPVDVERREIAGVDPDRVRAEGDGSFELVGVVGLDEGVEAETGGDGHETRRLIVVEVSQEQQNRVRAASFELRQLVRLAEEPLREERQGGGCACCTKVVDRAREALVDEYRHSRSA